MTHVEPHQPDVLQPLHKNIWVHILTTPVSTLYELPVRGIRPQEQISPVRVKQKHFNHQLINMSIYQNITLSCFQHFFHDQLQILPNPLIAYTQFS